MRNIIFTICLFLLPFLLKAQEKFTIDLSSDIGLYNSSLDAQTLLNSLGYIDEDQKQAILKNMDDENFYYVDINNVIKFTTRKGISLAFGNHVSSYGIFDGELVRLGLYGNTSSSAQSFDLTPVEGKFFHYSDITLGYDISEQLSASVSLIAGHQFVSGEFSKLDYASAEYGQSISYDMALEGIESVPVRYIIDNGSDLTALKGIDELFKSVGSGFSVGFDYKGEIYDGNYMISVKDLGFIKWDESARHFDIVADDIIVPMEVSDFSEIESSYFTAELDTLRDLINPYNESYTFTLPARLNGSFNKEIVGNKYTDGYTITAEHRVGMYPRPRLAVDFHKTLKKHELTLGYHLGGLEKNGLQFKYNYKADSIHLQLFTRQANIFDLNSMYGINVGIGVKFLFAKRDKKE
ncbi:MAG: hypothetical protein ISP71_01925 [Flavobacteriales bacterium]|nr:hypothetical protein [Flavobacteriales bacterium]